jgi:hypothetical protein
MDKPAAAAKVALPKIDVDALVALQKANLDTFVAAQKIIFDLAQTIARRNVDVAKEFMAKAEAALKGGFDAKKQPGAYVEEAKSALEKVVADAKETLDLGIKAQNEVVDLFVKRATANFDQVKSLAA